MAKLVVGLFDTLSEAQAAIQDLHAAGFRSEDISFLAQGEYDVEREGRRTEADTGTEAEAGAAVGATSGALLGGLGGLLVGLGTLAIPGVGPVVGAGVLLSTLVGAGVGAAAGGLIGVLVGAGIPEEEAHVYAEGIRRGGALVTVQTATEEAAYRAADILNRHHAVDIDQRHQEYREAGWTRFDETAGPYAAAGAGYASVSPVDRDTAYAGTTGTAYGSMAETPERADYDTTLDTADRRQSTDYARSDIQQGSEVTVPVVEEEARVSKREMEGSGARVTTRVEETPVEEQVTVRDETVDVERRPADRPASEADLAAFQEGTVEVRERYEEPVVEKEARVVEEIEIRKDVDERTETVQDTVRRTDVDVEDLSGQATAGGYRETGTALPESTTEQREPELTDRIEEATGRDIDRDEDIAGRGQA
jgi:stress response protein YsnF